MAMLLVVDIFCLPFTSLRNIRSAATNAPIGNHMSKNRGEKFSSPIPGNELKKE